jgi:hypothetical protein
LDYCPWLIIFRTLPVATSFAVVVLGVAGAVVKPIGWIFAEKVFISEEIYDENPSEFQLQRTPYGALLPDAPPTTELASAFGQGVEQVFTTMTHPVRQLLKMELGARRFFYYSIGLLWTLAVWAFVGTAIARVAVLRIGLDQRIGLDDAVRFATRKASATFGAVAVPLSAVVLLTIPLMVLGLFLKFDFGVVLLGIGWILVLGIAFMICLILLTLLFAWPLAVSATAAEAQDAFDSMNRAFAYTFQRPQNYLFYALLALVFGGLVWLLVAWLTNGVIHTAQWGVSWGLGNETRIEQLAADEIGDMTNPPSDMFRTGRSIINFWNGVARTLGAGVIYGLFWTLAAAIYLLLRSDVDNTEIDELYTEDDDRPYELPSLSVPPGTATPSGASSGVATVRDVPPPSTS